MNEFEQQYIFTFSDCIYGTIMMKFWQYIKNIK